METMTTTQTTSLALVVARPRPCTRRADHGTTRSNAFTGSDPCFRSSTWRGDLNTTTTANYMGENCAFSTTDAVIDTKRSTRHLGTRST